MKDKLTILIVDDEQEMRELWRLMIEAAIDAEFLFAENGEEAIQILEVRKVDLIVSDYYMPHKNGGELFVYNANRLNLPFILILKSGVPISKFPELRLFINFNPGNRYFNKPIDPETLVNQIIKIIELRNKG